VQQRHFASGALLLVPGVHMISHEIAISNKNRHNIRMMHSKNTCTRRHTSKRKLSETMTTQHDTAHVKPSLIARASGIY
jgi:hypothetical protein